MTVTSPTEINAFLSSGSTIVLNCSFEKETGELVNQLSWSKKNETGDYYRKIISYYQTYFSYFDPDMQTRSNSITFENSPSAILNISEVQCKDDGQYQCIVEYRSSNLIPKETSTKINVTIKGKNVSCHKNFLCKYN